MTTGFSSLKTVIASATHCNTLQHTATHDKMLTLMRCVRMTNGSSSLMKVCCSVLQCVAVCRILLQCVAVCCSVLQCVAV